jgi:hypothetical protein
VPCYTTSPHGLIPPPIKRSRIMVSGGVVLANLGKSLKKIVAAIFAAARTLPENSCSRHPTIRYTVIKLKEKVALCGANKIDGPLPRELQYST